MSLDMGQFIVDHLLFDFFPHPLCLGFWKFWNTNEFLVLLGDEFWEENVAGMIASTFGVMPSIIRVLTGQNTREHNLNCRKKKKDQNFKIPPTSLTNAFTRETFPLPCYFPSPFPPPNCRFMHAVIPPCKLHEKYFQFSSNISRCAAFLLVPKASMVLFESFSVKIIASVCKNQVGLSPFKGGVECQSPRIYGEVIGSADSPEFELPFVQEALTVPLWLSPPESVRAH